MKDWQYHLLNSAIAGALITLGSLAPVFTGDADYRSICIGLGVGLVAGGIVFLNKMQDWLKSQDPDVPKTNLKLMNFL